MKISIICNMLSRNGPREISARLDLTPRECCDCDRCDWMQARTSAWTPRSSLLLVTRTRQAAITVYAKHLSDSADREIVPQFTPQPPPKIERLNSEHTVTTKCSFTRFGTINAWINCSNWSGRVWMGDSDMLIAVSCPGSVCVIFIYLFFSKCIATEPSADPLSTAMSSMLIE